MIVTPTLWNVQLTAEGALLDTPYGRIVHVERARPLMSIGDFVRVRLGGRTGFTLAFEATVTDEGEYAAIATADSATAHLAWGVVFGDEHYAWYESETGHVASVKTLTRAHRLGLGPRWRQFRYAPPPGWDALARGLITDWFAPGFPNRWTVMTVYPAFPAAAKSASVIPMLLASSTAHGFIVTKQLAVTALESMYGLNGMYTEVEGTFFRVPTRRAIAAFIDDRIVYALELQTRSLASWDDAREAFFKVCTSAEPLPSQQGPAAWVE